MKEEKVVNIIIIILMATNIIFPSITGTTNLFTSNAGWFCAIGWFCFVVHLGKVKCVN